MKRWSWAGLLIVGVVLAAAGHSWAADEPSPQAISGDFHRLGLAVRWGIDLGVPQSEEIAYVAVLDDVVATLELPSNMLTVVSASDGRLLWRRVVTSSAAALFSPFRSPSNEQINENGQLLIPLNKLIMVNSENEIYMFSVVDGHLAGTSDLPTAVDNAPAIADSYAIFGAANGQAIGIDLVSGFKRWAYRMPAAIVARPVIIKPSVFVADSSGVYAMIVSYPYSPEDVAGTLRWKGRTFDKIETPPAVDSQSIYLSSEDQSLYCLSRVDGHDRWIYRAGEPLRLSPYVLGTSLYLPLPSGSLVSIDPAIGTKIWSFPHLAKPVQLQGKRLLLNGGDVLWDVDNKTGKINQEVPTQALRAVLPADHNSLIMVTPSGLIERLDPEY